MKDNEKKVNHPLPKTSWGTLTQAPVPQSVPQSNPDPFGKSIVNLSPCTLRSANMQMNCSLKVCAIFRSSGA